MGRHAFFGKIDKSKSGLKKSDLVQNKHGRVVSKKNHLRGKQSPWIAAVQKARKELKIKGFSARRTTSVASSHLGLQQFRRLARNSRSRAFQQEEPPPWQAVTLDCSSSEGSQGTQDQGLFSYQEGHSTLQKGQGALRPVSSKSMSNLLQTWGFLRLSSAGASVLESFGINDEGCT